MIELFLLVTCYCLNLFIQHSLCGTYGDGEVDLVNDEGPAAACSLPFMYTLPSVVDLCNQHFASYLSRYFVLLYIIVMHRPTRHRVLTM